MHSQPVSDSLPEPRTMITTFGLLTVLVFSDVRAGAGADAQPLIKVTRTFLNSAEISPLQYGQFMEYLCNLFPSMWAEKLYDGSFEGLSPYKVAFLKQTDFREKPWYPDGAANRGDYSLDTSNPVSGAVSQKIVARSGAYCVVGLSQ